MTAIKKQRAILGRSIVDLMKWQPDPAPWPNMILSALATCIPLVIGLLCGQLVISIYGALAGYILGLSDHAGRLGHRLWAITLSCGLLIAGFTAGVHLQGHPVVYQILFATLVYWLGVLAGEGAEMEKALLFTAIAMVSAYLAPPIPKVILPLLWAYIGIGYCCLMIGIPLLAWWQKAPPQPITGFRKALKKSWTLEKEKHFHAATYTLMALLSLWLTEYFQLERGQWVTITVLLVMKPDRQQTLQRVFQRIIGTVLAVLCVDLLLPTVHDTRWLIPVVIGCALSMPWAMKKNYWLVSFFATIMVVLLLDLAAPAQGGLHTPFVRLMATLFGCLIGLVGAGISRLGDARLGEEVG